MSMQASFTFHSVIQTLLHPPLSAIPSTSTGVMTTSVSTTSGTGTGTRSAGKRKQSAVPDLENCGLLKCYGSRVSRSNPQPGDMAILHSFQGLMNHFSDIVQVNNESQPHTILKDATSKLTGAWGLLINSPMSKNCSYQTLSSGSSYHITLHIQ